jgi:hypothetical protein
VRPLTDAEHEQVEVGLRSSAAFVLRRCQIRLARARGEAPVNPIEPKWGHGQRRVAEPARRLPARELIERVCAAFDCEHAPQLAMAQDAA